ncbi:hypothetical protein DITRI_Ditri14bG0064600 [Diplodiscus trichospermus]
MFHRSLALIDLILQNYYPHFVKNQYLFSVFSHNVAPFAESATYNIPNKDRNSVFHEERVEPCHLSSSLYYGGQDIYSHSSSTQTSTSYPIFKKDGGEDDPNGNNSQDASRGNWWQGSLYY